MIREVGNFQELPKNSRKKRMIAKKRDNRVKQE